MAIGERRLVRGVKAAGLDHEALAAPLAARCWSAAGQRRRAEKRQ